MNCAYKGIEIGDLSKLSPIIQAHLPNKLATDLNDKLSSIRTNDDEQKTNKNIIEFINICCAYRPVNIEEYTAFVMIATSMKLLKISSMEILEKKFQLMAHTFHFYTDHWITDIKKIIIVAEAIWMITTDVQDVKHLIFEINSFTTFSYNVSLALLSAAFGKLTKKPLKKNPMQLTSANEFIDCFLIKNASEERLSQKFILDFLLLFQIYQKMVLLRLDHPNINQQLKDYMGFERFQLNDLDAALQELDSYLHSNIVVNKFKEDEFDPDANQRMVLEINFILEDLNIIIKSVNESID